MILKVGNENRPEENSYACKDWQGTIARATVPCHIGLARSYFFRTLTIWAITVSGEGDASTPTNKASFL